MTNVKNDNITTFNWKQFPVEYSSFSVCVCFEDNDLLIHSGAIDKDILLSFLKIIFPSHIHSGAIENNKGKTTKIYNFDIEDIKWTTNNNILQKHLSKKGHSIFVGKYDNIPNIIFTISDILIFTNLNNVNKYLERHNIQINNFDEQKYFLVIDKRRLGFSFHGIDKKELERYY